MIADREQFKRVTTLFPQTEDGCCRVCKDECPGRRRTYCSDYCKRVAKATQRFYTWQSLRKKVLERDDWTCQRCSKGMEDVLDEWEKEHGKRPHRSHFTQNFHIDHIKPVSKGGKMFDMDNLQVLCEDCNLSKSDTWDGRKNLNDFFDADIGEEMAKDLSQDKRTKTTNEV